MGADLVLGKVVVGQQLSVIEYAHHVVPSGIGIGDGLACQGAFAVPHPLGLHPFLHFLHDGSGFGLTLRLACLGVHTETVALMLDMIESGYFVKKPLRGLAVFVFGLKPVAADMHHAEDQAHRSTRPEGRRIAAVAVTLKVSVEVILVGLLFDHISCPGAIAVEEHDQPFHYRPAHPEIFLVGLMPVVVYHRHRAFIRLYVMAAEHFGHKHIVKRS